MSWSAGQLRLLRALGHEPMQFAPPGSNVGAAFGRDSSIGKDELSRPKAAPTHQDSTGKLAASIARAAGGRDLGTLALDLERLRREPALKRALWPRLRALRREH